MDCTWSNRGSCDKFSKIKKKTTSKNAPFLFITLLGMLLLNVIDCYYSKNFACHRNNTEKTLRKN